VVFHPADELGTKGIPYIRYRNIMSGSKRHEIFEWESEKKFAFSI
jgi:hypothetical protein